MMNVSPTKAKKDDVSTPICIITSDMEEHNPNKIFLGGIPPEATEKKLEEFFSEYGKVKDVRIVTDRITAESKGYGFVTFADGENIEDLVMKRAVRMNGKKLRIRKAVRRNSSQFEHIAPKRNSITYITLENQQVNATSAAPLLTTSMISSSMIPCYQPLTPPTSPVHQMPKPIHAHIQDAPIIIPQRRMSAFNEMPQPMIRQEYSPPLYYVSQPPAMMVPAQPKWQMYPMNYN